MNSQVKFSVECAATVADLKVGSPSLVVLPGRPLYFAVDADGDAVIEVRERRDEGANGVVGHRVAHKVEVYILSCAAVASR